MIDIMLLPRNIQIGEAAIEVRTVYSTFFPDHV